MEYPRLQYTVTFRFDVSAYDPEEAGSILDDIRNVADISTLEVKLLLTEEDHEDPPVDP